MYYCDRCQKTFKWKNDIRRHLNRKNPCGEPNSSVTIEYVKKKYGLLENDNIPPKIGGIPAKNDSLSAKNDSLSAKNGSFSAKNGPFSAKNDLFPAKNDLFPAKNSSFSAKKEMVLLETKFKCDYCQRFFTRKDSLTKHINKNRCKVLKKKLELAKVDEPNTIINSMINSNNTQNITNNTQNIINNTQNITNNNITINYLGSENTSYISQDDLKNAIENPAKGLVKLVELIHFNTEHPENNNIKMHNKKDKFLDSFLDNNWKFVDKKKMIDYLISSKKELTDNFVDTVDDIDKKTLDAYDEYSEAIDFYIYKFILNSYYPPSKKSYKKIYKQLFDDIVLMIVNHKRIVTHMHQNMML